jgi:hypothetical protein
MHTTLTGGFDNKVSGYLVTILGERTFSDRVMSPGSGKLEWNTYSFAGREVQDAIDCSYP